MGAGESGLPFVNIGGIYETLKFGWTDTALGNGVGINIASTPTFWLFSQIQNLGVSSLVIQALFFVFIFLVAGLSIYFLTKELFPSLSGKFVFLAVLFYWFNPISLVNVWNRFLYNYMAFWALLPLVFFLFLRGIKTKKYKYAIFTSLSTAIFSYALTATPFNMLIWFLFLGIVLFYFIVADNAKERLFLLFYLVLTTISFVVFNFWWISQLFTFVFSSDYNTATANFFTSTGNLGTLNSLSNSLGRLVNIFRFMHGTFFIDGPGWAKFYNLPIVSGTGFILAAVIFWTVVKFKRTKEILFLGFFLIISIFLTKGNAPPFGELSQYFFLKISILQVFRNPFEKFSFLVVLFSTPLLAFGLEHAIKKYASSKFKKIIIFSAIAVVVILYSFPFFTGKIFTHENIDNKDKQISYEVNVPDYYKKINDWISLQGSGFRFVSIPIGGEGTTYNWEIPYSGVESSSVLFDSPNISFNTSIPFYSDLVNELSKYQLNKSLLNFLPYVNGRYILWRGDINYKLRQMANPSIVKDILDQWGNEGLISKSIEAGNLIAYQVKNGYFWPKVYSTSEIYFSNSKNLAFLSSFFEGFPQKENVVIGINNISSNLVHKKAIYVPDKIYFQSVISPLPENLTDDELLGKLFYANHLPGDLVYPLVRLNEKILEIREKDPDGWVLYRTGILGKRVAEIYKLKKLGESANLIASAQKDYENELSGMSPNIIGLIKMGGPVANVVKDSLIYQWVLLDRVGLGPTITLLSDLLSKWDVKATFELPLSDNIYVIANFKLPVDGNYLLYGAEKGTVFIDGKELTTGKNEPIELKSGTHEVSLNLKDNEIYKSVVDQPGDIYIDQKNFQHWDFAIPDTPKKYQVEFDYRFDTGKTFGVKVVQDLENDESPSFDNKIAFSPEYYGWKHYDEEMDSTPGASKAYLSFSSVKEAFCNRLWWGWTSCGTQDSQFGVEIRNLRIREVDTPELSLVMNGDSKNNFPPSQTSFEEVNPTFYKVHIDKSNNNPEVLVLSELYNTSWKLSYTNGEQIPDSSHFLVNDYANGWVINKSGSYDLLINFAPQKVLESGEKISLYSIIVAVLVITLYTIWRKKHEVA
jgi:hypothetical protein